MFYVLTYNELCVFNYIMLYVCISVPLPREILLQLERARERGQVGPSGLLIYMWVKHIQLCNHFNCLMDLNYVNTNATVSAQILNSYICSCE